MMGFERPDADDLSLEAILRALADADRLAIIRRLAQGDELCCRTAGGPDLPKATLSRHFKTLRQAGLVETRKDGQAHLSRLRRECVDGKFPGLLDAVLNAPEDALGERDEAA